MRGFDRHWIKFPNLSTDLWIRRACKIPGIFPVFTGAPARRERGRVGAALDLHRTTNRRARLSHPEHRSSERQRGGS